MNALALVIACLSATSTFRVDASYGDVVGAVERMANEPRAVPFKLPNLPAIVRAVDVQATLFVRPSARYYRLDVILERPLGKLTRFDKRLEVWGEPQSYLVRSRVDITWGRGRCCIVRLLTQAAERKVLEFERERILLHAARAKANAEPTEEVTWARIGMLVLDKMLK